MLAHISEFIAILGVGILCGAMIYESIIEIGVRKKTNPQQKLANWQLCFPAVSGLFKPFGIVLVPITIIAGAMSGKELWYLISFTLFLLLPFTTIAIAPTNTKLLAMTNETPDREIEAAINKWDSRHHVRTTLITISFFMSAITILFL